MEEQARCATTFPSVPRKNQKARIQKLKGKVAGEGGGEEGKGRKLPEGGEGWARLSGLGRNL